MSSQFAVGYSADAVQYNQGQAYYLLGGESSNGDVIPGNLLVTGNLAVTGTTTLTGATSMQTANAASLGVTGQLSTTGLLLAAGAAGASVTGAGGLNVTAGAIVGGALAVTGAVGCGAITSTGNVTSALNVFVPFNGRYLNSATINIPAGLGFSGTRGWTVAVTGNNNNIGMNALINQADIPHVFSVYVNSTTEGAPYASYGLIQSFPAATGKDPVLTAGFEGNGLTWTALTGTPGNYVLNLNTNIDRTVLVTVTMII